MTAQKLNPRLGRRPWPGIRDISGYDVFFPVVTRSCQGADGRRGRNRLNVAPPAATSVSISVDGSGTAVGGSSRISADEYVVLWKFEVNEKGKAVPTPLNITSIGLVAS